MDRKFISDFSEQEFVAQVFRAGNKLLRPNKNGDMYLQVDISDKSGTLTARMWNATEAQYHQFENGDYIYVEGKVQVYQGAKQVIAKKISRVDATTVNEDDFLQIPHISVEKLLLRMTELLRGVQDENMANLVQCYLMDEEYMNLFMRAPAGVKHHHAYQGGLLEHTLGVMEMAYKIAPCYPYMNADLLLVGAFLHDTGKVNELFYENDFTYSDEGQMLGHIILGLEMLQDRISEAEKLSGEPFPEELKLQLRHLILSHHGEYEFGSPKLPMTLEAQALHCLDLLDSKISAFYQMISEDMNTDSAWTVYAPTLQRKIYKGR